jgi:hypothetical protein
MNARLGAVAALALAGIGFNALGLVRHGPVLDTGSEIQLLQPQVGEYRQTEKSWHNAMRGGTIEEGAVYSYGAGVPVQLDFFRHNHEPHNGLGCYLAGGETLLWERMQHLPTLNGNAEFDLGLAQTKGTLRLVAASECRAHGCSEVPLPMWRQFADFKKLIPQLFDDPTGDVVPVSIVLTVPADQRDPALEADLMRQLQTFIAALDLAPARKLAAIQDTDSDTRDADAAPGSDAAKVSALK